MTSGVTWWQMFTVYAYMCTIGLSLSLSSSSSSSSSYYYYYYYCCCCCIVSSYFVFQNIFQHSVRNSSLCQCEMISSSVIYLSSTCTFVANEFVCILRSCFCCRRVINGAHLFSGLPPFVRHNLAR